MALSASHLAKKKKFKKNFSPMDDIVSEKKNHGHQSSFTFYAQKPYYCPFFGILSSLCILMFHNYVMSMSSYVILK